MKSRSMLLRGQTDCDAGRLLAQRRGWAGGCSAALNRPWRSLQAPPRASLTSRGTDYSRSSARKRRLRDYSAIVLLAIADRKC